jgi:multisubunit Na+/H+ antiporter MnhF subunit
MSAFASLALRGLMQVSFIGIALASFFILLFALLGGAIIFAVALLAGIIGYGLAFKAIDRRLIDGPSSTDYVLAMALCIPGIAGLIYFLPLFLESIHAMSVAQRYLAK